MKLKLALVRARFREFKERKPRNLYRVLRYMSRRGRYPDGLLISALNKRFDENIVSELKYYDYLETVHPASLRITVRGREALNIHTLTVVNSWVAVLAAVAAVVALFL